MKTIIAITIVAFSILSFVAADCDQTALRPCANTLGGCVNTATGDKTTQCVCYGNFVGCAKNASCTTTDIQSYTKTCDRIGCTVEQCDATSLVVSFGIAALLVLAF